jgi:hypothetical protein
MSLTPAELAAARAFRGAQRAALAALDADITADVHARFVRHDCARRGGKSYALELREHYAFSPAYLVEGSTVTPGEDPDVLRGISRVAGGEFIEPGRFGWVWTQGKCPACGMTARSSAGRLVDPAERPPAERAVTGV